MIRLILCAALWMTLLVGPSWGQSSSHEKEIAKAYREWVNATNAKDIERWASFLVPGALFLPPNSPALTTESAIRGFYLELFADERFSLDCRQERVEVAGSEDLAWSTGHCEATFTGSDGEESHDRSKWAKVWKRLPTGEWKCTLNSWSSTRTK